MRHRVARLGLRAAAGAAALAAASAAPALAQPANPINGIIDRLRLLLVGFLVGLATLRLTVGGTRYLLADDDPSQVERAKKSMRAAAWGYGLAALAAPLVELLRWVVGA